MRFIHWVVSFTFASSSNELCVVRLCLCLRLPLGAVSLAGADSGLWAVDGGNKMVCSGLLYHSRAELIPARVTSISVKVRPSKAGKEWRLVWYYIT